MSALVLARLRALFVEPAAAGRDAAADHAAAACAPTRSTPAFGLAARAFAPPRPPTLDTGEVTVRAAASRVTAAPRASAAPRGSAAPRALAAPRASVAPRASAPPLASAAPRASAAALAVPATLGLLVAPGEAAAVGAALALTAAARRRAPCAVVCRWTGGPPLAPTSGAAVGAARRLTERLATRGLVAGARGRLVTVTLPAALAEARTAAERAIAAAGGVPVVVVIAGPRPPELDPLLAALDRLLVAPPADAAPGLEALALAAAADLGRATAVLRLPQAATLSGRIAADLGLLISPSLRAAAAAALEDGDAA
jgi:hypothetical protein